ncbi:MAG: copper ABC transporter ATP-binding protein [Ignavibacteria bacterium GWB2_35_12]|nr:MAG: copper ABC transporter ATP-binding protein [Ignavibacteria bacterium GWA2_35_8]OGU41519.1 MAG: copper ABC transporter ATP-binding protein [Ignavibacteria bacterium GWB2_35_12]OGU93006.1 MAG: copper ABC transporter ATP-binding protein [Ignavibacteria bacterium RIFOXYA2_FULL_35_10]OGV22993.1 MAG: copper ABC transporter ATP-binding protein [Ignavibacteria bacterium RIFOXYC2_FULL_35_21]
MIRIEGLNKSFGKLHVLKNINLEIEKGKITAIIGPNGSGKTTLIKIILGLMKPDSGKIFVDNKDISKEVEYKNHIGSMPQIARFPENLRVVELINMLNDLRAGKNGVDKELFDSYNLNNELNKMMRTLSGGTRQRVNAALAFMFQPDILILDEPTAGLDPISSSKLKDKILKEQKKEKTVIITSHIMSDIEELAENLIFILEGKIIYNGTVKGLIEDKGKINLERTIASLMESNGK